MNYILFVSLLLYLFIVYKSFAREFSSGYLIGELLNKYELQEDFDQFSQSRLANAKLNNFSRMEPTLQLLGVQFDQNVARSIMTEQHGAAIKLVYQLYVALEKKKKAGLTGVAMDAMRPSANAKLKSVGTEIYRERLRTLVPRQADLSLQQISDSFQNKAKILESKMVGMQLVKQQQAKQIQEEKKKIAEKRRQNEIMAKIQAAVIQIPKPLPQHTDKAIEDHKLQKKKKEAEVKLATAKPVITELLNTYSDDEYIRKIQKRLEEDTFAREQREKRRRKMLREQFIAHEAQEEAYREEQLINRLMRQSQQERRIAVQLMHVRHEKEVLWQNRIYREKQFEERRLKEFQEALDREEALAKQEKIELAEQALREKQLHAKLAAERAEARYKKHYEICWEVVEQIIDLATKIGEYRTLTNNLIPAKLMHDWKELFLKGKPIYEQADISDLPDEPTPEQLVELDKINLLDEKDYDEYKAMVEEWYPPEEIRVNKPPPDNVILGHVIHRLMELVYPPEPEPPPSIFSPFPMKGCILGKLYSGKTTCLNFLGKVFNIQVLSLDALIAEAIKSFHENEMVVVSLLPVRMEGSSLNQIHVSKTWHGMLSIRAQLGAAAETLLKKGKNIPDELLVGIMVEAISRLQPEKGWIMDGFPMTLNQAKLLEKALTGRDPDQTETNIINLKKPTLVTDPAASKEPPVHPPGLDFAILLDVTDSIVMNRIATEKGKISIDIEQNFSICDLDFDILLCRIIGFLDAWPQLEAWYSEQQNILTKVNADVEKSLMCQRIKEILTGEIIKIQSKGMKYYFTLDFFFKGKGIAVDFTLLVIANYRGRCSSLFQGKGQAKSMSSSPEDMLPFSTIEPPPIKPGSSEWIYCDNPIPQEIAEFLVPYWETIEKTYINNIKATLRCLRDEQHVIIHYLSDIRNHFKDYLKRPDHKQEFVTQWQVDYNSVADDLWDDDETKEELHQRVTDLRDRLWDICENRRDEAEQERCDIMNDGWLPDRIGLLMNHIFSLMQNEMDRFQDTKKVLHDYYRAMEGKIPIDTSSDFSRIPLIDLMERRLSMEECKMKMYDKNGRIATISKEICLCWKLIIALLRKHLHINAPNISVNKHWYIKFQVSSEIQTKEAEEEKERLQEEMKEKERLKSSQTIAGKGGKEGKGKGGKGEKEAKGGKEAKEKDSKDAKKGKKKGKQSLVTYCGPIQSRTSKQILEDFSASSRSEAAKSRLELLKVKGLAFLEDLQSKAEETYRNMEKWLGERYLAEMSSVDKLIGVARNRIETSSRIQFELALEGTDFYVNGDIKVFEDPTLPPRPPSVETATNSTLTISQLSSLHKQFLQVAPKGLIPNKTFIDILFDLITLNLGSNMLPDAWLHLSMYDLQSLSLFLLVNLDTVDWRRFLHAVSQPWPIPSVTELLETLQRFQDVDTEGSGFVTQEEYDQVGLWFKESEDLGIPESPLEPLPFNRQKHLIEFLFNLFADPEKDPPQLNYTKMLLYFASYPDAVDGVYRALSVATGIYIQRKRKKHFSLPQMEQAEEEAGEEGEEEAEEEMEEKEKEDDALSIGKDGYISLATLLHVFQHETNKAFDNHRFSSHLTEEDNYEHFIKVYKDLGSEELQPIKIELLLKHPFIHDLINNYQGYKLPVIMEKKPS
uniref:Sperm flagellar 2 n=1 Tax=Naja naja TaxID=35670 RepID=A0A8C6XV00_NAJNA